MSHTRPTEVTTVAMTKNVRLLACSYRDAYISARSRSGRLNTRGNAMPRLSPNPTVGKSGKHLISQSISILRVLLCLGLAGCSANDETVTPPQSQAPKIVVPPSIVVSDLGARITATVNPNGIETECYFEYGPTVTYGRRLATKII